jgi:hypothetical protein
MSFISVLQPRNPEVWAQQSQDAAWNIANVQRDPAVRWNWIMVGFRTLDRGMKTLPDNPYLKFEVARTLYHKPTITHGQFDDWYLSQVEGDAELQAMLQGDSKPARAKSAFELTIPFLERAAAEIRGLRERNGFRYYTSQTGLNLHLSTLDGYQANCMGYEAHRLWRAGRPKEAAEWFRRASKRSQEVYDEHAMPIYREYGRIHAACAEVAELDAATSPHDPAKILKALEERVLPTAKGLDFGYVRTMAGVCRMALGGDGWEWNDNASYATDLPFGRGLEADLSGGADVDWYVIGLYQVEGLESHSVTVQNDGGVPLLVRIFEVQDGALKEQLRQELGAGQGGFVRFAVAAPGNYFVEVRPTRPVAAGTSTKYRLAWNQ